MARGISIGDVENKVQNINDDNVIPISTGADVPEVVEVGTLKEHIQEGLDFYEKPSAGIPKSDLAADVRTSLGKADTALQSFTETDPTVPAWAKQSSKPSYSYSEITGKPTLSTVATSGDYNDLTNTPTIPDVPEWAMSSTKPSYTVSEISGAQEELESGVNIKTINNESILGSGNITIQGGGGDVNVIEGITFNGSAVPVDVNKNAAITYTETEPDFNGSAAADITAADITAWNGKSTFSGSYNDLTDKPTLFSGNYNDLSNKPTIPTVPTSLSSFTDDLGSNPTHTHSQYLTSASISGKEDSSNKVTSLSSSSTDTQYPSAKCVYDLVGDIETLLAAI